MKKNDYEYDIEKILTQLTCPDDEFVEQIANELPVLDDTAKNRIANLCERKIGVDMKNDNIKTNIQNHDTVTGVESYTKPKWYRHIIPIAASLVLIAGVGIGVSLLNNYSDSSITPATQTKNTEASQTSFKAVICEENAEGSYIVKPLEGEDELKSSDKFSIQAESGLFKGELVEITYDGYIQTIYPASIGETSVRVIATQSPDDAIRQYFYAENSAIEVTAVHIGQYSDILTWQYKYAPLSEQFGLSQEASVGEAIIDYIDADGNEHSEVMVIPVSDEKGYHVIDHFPYEPHEISGSVTEVLEIADEGNVQYYMVQSEGSTEEIKVYSYARYGNYLDGDVDETFKVGDIVKITYNGELQYGKDTDNRVENMTLYDTAAIAEEFESQLEDIQNEIEAEINGQDEAEDALIQIEDDMQVAQQELQQQTEKAQHVQGVAAAEAAGLTIDELRKLFKDSIYCELLYLDSLHTCETEGGPIDGENLYLVSPYRFKSYADFAELIRSTYCKETADSILTSSEKFTGFSPSDKPLYVEYDGMLCIDKSIAVPMYSMMFSMNSSFAIQIISFEENICEFKVINTEWNLNGASVTRTAVLEENGWRIKEI